jgi:hypothetical protein
MSYIYSFPMLLPSGQLYSLRAETYPLDLVTGATGAWSLRKLAAAYAGPCLKVRRSSDNTTLDIGFSGYVLDFPALSAFVGANSGFIDTWYDQSGNSRNVSNATAGTQPQLLSSGAYFVDLGNYPALEFTGSFLLNSAVNMSTFITTTNGTVFSVFLADSGGTGSGGVGRKVWAQVGENASFAVDTTPNLQSSVFTSSYLIAAVGISLSTPYVGVWRHDSSDTTLKVYANSQTAGNSITAGTSASLAAALRMGNSSGGPGHDGRLTEIICYTTALSGTDLNSVGGACASPFGISWS